ncbi:methyltransferase, FkbM family [Robiginitalea myxolifaciens]|uniref:Methyltransferase, FkbM family n=1 Tax=Robiginitalea myxolifaciens TaxID=400055 RepID=A0A1I6FYD1_9FLAO|nr:FkbM family methyltransferase [Robiginitalea myxolifaciens]SFR34943.1 methyltransferase, FkbM family [Robiginitalea myxolifaciens]
MLRLFRKFIYTRSINSLLRSVGKGFGKLWPEGLKLHPSHQIRLKFGSDVRFKLVTNQTSYISRQLYWEGPENFEYSDIFEPLIRKVRGFWDIGGNIGYYTILAGAANPDIQVEVFEPSPGPLGYLKENIALNGLQEQVVVHAIALSDQSGTLDFQEVFNPKFPGLPNLSGEHNLGTKEGLNAQRIRVEAKTLDSFQEGKAPMDLVKIDVEGAEPMVLRGGMERIRTERPIIICELLFNRNETEIEALIKPLGYQLYAHQDKGLSPIETLVRETDNGVRNVFMIPAEKVAIVTEFLI